MLVIVGHGPSILSGRGALIDTMTVIRLKEGLKPGYDPEHWGTRTDYLCARSLTYKDEKSKVPFWHFDEDKNKPGKWLKYFATFKPKLWKPSIGLSAVFMAIDRLAPKEIALIGFDRVLNPDDDRSHKWHNSAGKPPHGWAHCQRAERECLYSLGINVIDLSKDAKVP